MSMQLTVRERLTYLGIGLGLLALVVLFGLEVRHMASTIGFARLGGLSLLIGLAVGGYFGYVLSRRSPELEEKMKYFAVSIVLALFFAPLFASLSNRLLGETDVLTYQFVKQEAMYARRYGFIRGEKVKADRYEIRLLRDNEMYMLSAKRPAPEGTQPGDLLDVVVNRGFWGYPILEGLSEE